MQHFCLLLMENTSLLDQKSLFRDNLRSIFQEWKYLSTRKRRTMENIKMGCFNVDFSLE